LSRKTSRTKTVSKKPKSKKKETKTTRTKKRETKTKKNAAEKKKKKLSKDDLLFRKIVRILKRFNPTQYGKSYEKNVEEQLVQALRFALPSPYRDQVTYEKEFGKGKRLDISVADTIGIEIKLSPTSAALDRLSGQVDRYLASKTFKRIVVLVVAGPTRREMVEEAKKRIETKKRGKVKVVIV